MIYKLFKEPNGEISSFFLFENFFDDNLISFTQNWLNSLDDLKLNLNYNQSKISRLQKWYHLNGSYFCSKWNGVYDKWTASFYDESLLFIQNVIINKLPFSVPTINSCLINKYIDGNSYIKPHRDTDLAFGKNPVIIGLSIGQSRDIVFKRSLYFGNNKYLNKKDQDKQHLNFSLSLPSGSLFVMGGASQKFWTHEIPKDNSSSPRFSLTFRHHIL